MVGWGSHAKATKTEQTQTHGASALKQKRKPLNLYSGSVTGRNNTMKNEIKRINAMLNQLRILRNNSPKLAHEDTGLTEKILIARNSLANLRNYIEVKSQ